MNYFYSVLIFILFSCQNYKIHEANLIEQNKTMLRNDEQSRKKQQKIRDSRKKRLKVYKSRNNRKFV